MSEVVIVLIILGILTVVATPLYRGIRSAMEENHQAMELRSGIAQARNVASRQENRYRYPETLAADLAEADDRYVVGPVNGPTEVSVYRESATVLYLAGLVDAGSCIVVVDDIETDMQYFAVDKEPATCDAAAAAGLSVTGSYQQPNTIELDS